MTEDKRVEGEKLAKLFHETYEKLAPKFGYETRKASAVSWVDVPKKNKKLMISVACEIILAQKKQCADDCIEDCVVIDENTSLLTKIKELTAEIAIKNEALGHINSETNRIHPKIRDSNKDSECFLWICSTSGKAITTTGKEVMDEVVKLRYENESMVKSILDWETENKRMGEALEKIERAHNQSGA